MSGDSELKSLKKLQKQLEERNIKLDKFNANKEQLNNCRMIINDTSEYCIKNPATEDNYKRLETEFKDEYIEKHTKDCKPVIFGLFGPCMFVFVIWFILACACASNKTFPNDSLFYNFGFCAAIIFGVPYVIAILYYSVQFFKRKNPRLTSKQLKRLDEAKEQDNKNHEENQQRIKEESKQFALKRVQDIEHAKKQIEELERENEGLSDEISKMNKAIKENNCIGEQEKYVDVVSMLIYFIETKRADTIKEALKEYDKACHDQHQLELERQKLVLEKQRANQEKLDRERQMEQEREHQIKVEAQMREDAIAREETARSIKKIEYDTQFNTYFKDK